MKRQPAISATSAVASREPASATITSPSRPAVAPGTSAASVGTRARSDSWVAMMALSMEPRPLNIGLHHIMWGLPNAPRDRALTAQIVGLLKCSCYVHIRLLGYRHGSIKRSPETPAGEGAALRAGGRLCRRRHRAARRGGRARAPARARRAEQRLRPLRAAGAHRLRRRLALARRIAAVQDHGADRRHPQDHHPQRLARHRLRPLDQSLSRLRARLRLLLRAADPRLSRPVARARFRIQTVREAGGGRAAGDANCRRPAIRRR